MCFHLRQFSKRFGCPFFDVFFHITDSGDKPKPCFLHMWNVSQWKWLVTNLIDLGDSRFSWRRWWRLSNEKWSFLALENQDGPCIGSNRLQILGFVSKKQTQVCRSTFTAELYIALDLAGLANNINSALMEVLTGCQLSKEVDHAEVPNP